VCFREVVQELKCPRTAVSANVFHLGADYQSAGVLNADQFLALLKLKQFIVVGYAWKLEAIDLFILAEQRLT
jgi:hypothetical protein